MLPCEAYDEERIYTLMKNGLSQLGGLDNLINKEEKILLKPNLLKKAEVEKAVITHAFRIINSRNLVFFQISVHSGALDHLFRSSVATGICKHNILITFLT